MNSKNFVKVLSMKNLKFNILIMYRKKKKNFK